MLAVKIIYAIEMKYAGIIICGRKAKKRTCAEKVVAQRGILWKYRNQSSVTRIFELYGAECTKPRKPSVYQAKARHQDIKPMSRNKIFKTASASGKICREILK